MVDSDSWEVNTGRREKYRFRDKGCRRYKERDRYVKIFMNEEVRERE